MYYSGYIEIYQIYGADNKNTISNTKQTYPLPEDTLQI